MPFCFGLCYSLVCKGLFCVCSDDGVGCWNGWWWEPGRQSFRWKETETAEGVHVWDAVWYYPVWHFTIWLHGPLGHLEFNSVVNSSTEPSLEQFTYLLSETRNLFWCGLPCGLRSVVELAHLVSWPSVVRGNWIRVVLFCCILGCLLTYIVSSGALNCRLTVV